LAAVVSLAWFLAQRAVGGETQTGQLLSNLGLILAAAYGSGACFLRAHRTPMVRRPWILIGLGAASWSLGQAVWTLYESGLRQEVPFPSLADLGYLGMVPLLAAGLLVLPGTPVVWSGRFRLLLDGCLVALAVWMLSWQLVLGDTVRGSEDGLLKTAISMAYPIGDVVWITVALVALSRARHNSLIGIRALLLLTAGTVSIAISDSGFTFLTLHDRYYSGHPIDLFWFVGFIVLGLAAAEPAAVPDPQAERPARLDLAAIGPYAVVLTAVGTDVTKEIGDGKLGPMLAWCTIALVLVLVMRQVLAVRENTLLTNDLERRVIDRTQALKDKESWFRNLVQNLSDVVVVLDADYLVTYQTPSSELHFGHLPDDSEGMALTQWWTPFDVVRLTGLLDELTHQPGKTRVFSGEVTHADGSGVPVEATVTSIAENNLLSGFVVSARDVTERRRLELELSHQAFHDSLTGLANRALFRDRVEHAIAGRHRDAKPLSVFFLDLDGFKGVNDTLGHAMGDELLQQVADQIRSRVRPADTVARFGGDEFAVLMESLDSDTSAVEVAQRIEEAIAQTVELSGRQVTLTASCGIAVFSGEETAEELLRNADLAMYRVKSAGGGGCEVFESSMHTALIARLELQSDLRLALSRKELVVFYQPTVNLATQAWTGTEALIRWQSPTRGLVPPLDFISVAEDIGIIDEIGSWVLHEACRQTAAWRRTSALLGELTVAVNVSPLQLTSRDFLTTVATALADSGLPPEALVIELTENILIERTDNMLTLLNELKATGVRLAIDDFGTGYSSLSYLSRFPVDILKIDQSFVSELSHGSDEEELARTIVRLGQSLGLMIVAEGIEEEDQLRRLRLMGCQLGQGYFFSRPVSAPDLLSSWSASAAVTVPQQAPAHALT